MGVRFFIHGAADDRVSVTRIHSYPLHAQGSIQRTMMRRTSVGKYHIRLTLQTLTMGSATVVTKLQMPPLLGHQGIPKKMVHFRVVVKGYISHRIDAGPRQNPTPVTSVEAGRSVDSWSIGRPLWVTPRDSDPLVPMP
jgi:hypothetical protein